MIELQNYNPETLVEDIGDEDCGLYVATASWRGITAEFASRDRFLAPRKALELLREKVEKLRCPKHPQVVRQHELQVCLQCEAEIDAAIMPTIFDEDRKSPAPRTPDTDHDFFEME